ncbi:MAG TPA: polymer-forming cytoskeletal protein [Vitreimonas sp.]|jgi:cytoskeletal protein CcmA (bactofilin family)|nr:polymer-forming cytoskeletal protein [Vitreimonas sp.]
MSEAMESVRRAASQSMTMLKGGSSVRTIEPTPAPPSQAAPAPVRATPTTISVNSEIKGSIVSSDSVDIGGKIEGDVRAKAITVLTGGNIKGDLIADTIMVYGQVEGRLQAQDVRLCAGANVTGEIAHGSLGIDTAANFEGSIKRIAAVQPAPTQAS